MSWATILTKLTDVLKTYAQAISSAVSSAFAKTINTDPAEANQMAGSLAFAETTLTVAAGVVTATRSCHAIDTEASAATDDLDTINVGSVSDGCLLLLRAANAGRITTLKNSTGNIVLPRDIALSATRTTFLRRNGSNWNLVETNLTEVLQRVSVTDATVKSSAVAIPFDNSIPQSGEGAEIEQLAITPINASSTLRHTVSFFVSIAAAKNNTVAIFRDAGADAIYAESISNTASGTVLVSFVFETSASAVTATTFKMRIGTNDGSTININADSGGTRLYGGVSKLTWLCDEIAPTSSL